MTIFIFFMNKTHLIANWKMQLLNSEAKNLASEIVNIDRACFSSLSDLGVDDRHAGNKENTEIVLCPSAVSIAPLSEILKNSAVKLGAQNLWPEQKGSFTGEISPTQLKELNVEYVILGHSERRKNNAEKDEQIHEKVKSALANDLTPIVCVGETFEERQEGQTDLVIINQVTKTLQGIQLDENQKIFIAYEPVWVIGSGQAVDPNEAKNTVRLIRKTMLDLLPQNIVENNLKVLYGGSVDAHNILNFIKPNLIDGVLIGGASLSIEKFKSIIEIISKTQETRNK